MKKIICLICLGALIAAAAGIAAAGPAKARPFLRPEATFTVTISTDAPDDNLSDHICNNGVVEGCTLRAAIMQAFSESSAATPVTIVFSPLLAGQTIPINLGILEWTANYVNLDGGSNQITINGAGLAAGQSIFKISGSNNVIQNLTLRGAPQDAIQVGDFYGVGFGNQNFIQNMTLLGSGYSGVYVYGGGSSGGMWNRLIGNRIGMSNPAASGCISGEGNGADGIFLASGAHHTTIQGNQIGCNGGNGIEIYSGVSSGTPAIQLTAVIFNEIGIGTNAPLPNGAAGVVDRYGYQSLLDFNNIASNGGAGVWLIGSDQDTITRNLIGMNRSGEARPNGANGIDISDGATANIIGSNSDINLGNLVSGNTGCGIRLRSGSHGNVIDANRIGTSAAGSAALPNTTAGVCIFNANTNFIGSSVAGLHQLISGNGREGVYIENASGNSVDQTSWIGVADDGTSALGNGLEGVKLVGASDTYVAASYVAYNGAPGISVNGTTAVGNQLIPKYSHHNAGLAIDLNGDGATPNGTHTPPGPNNWQEYPGVSAFNVGGNTLQGKACNNCSVVIYQAVGNPRASGGGGLFLNRVTADGSGNWSMVLTPAQMAARITLVAIKPGASSFSGDTSEMSPATAVIFLPIVRK